MDIDMLYPIFTFFMLYRNTHFVFSLLHFFLYLFTLSIDNNRAIGGAGGRGMVFMYCFVLFCYISGERGVLFHTLLWHFCFFTLWFMAMSGELRHEAWRALEKLRSSWVCLSPSAVPRDRATIVYFLSSLLVAFLPFAVLVVDSTGNCF